MKVAQSIDFSTLISSVFSTRFSLAPLSAQPPNPGETDGMIKLDGEFKTASYGWRVTENKWDGTNEETFLTEIAAPTTSLTTELTLFNKSKRTCKFLVEQAFLRPFFLLIYITLHSTWGQSSIFNEFSALQFSASVKNKIIKKTNQAMADYSDEWRNSVSETGIYSLSVYFH